jgi:hypothetical protein
MVGQDEPTDACRPLTMQLGPRIQHAALPAASRRSRWVPPDVRSILNQILLEAYLGWRLLRTIKKSGDINSQE